MSKLIALIKTVLFANKAVAAATIIGTCTVVTVGTAATGAYIQNKKAAEPEQTVIEAEDEVASSIIVESNGDNDKLNSEEVLSDSSAEIINEETDTKEEKDKKKEKKQTEIEHNNKEKDTNHQNQNENTNHNSNTDSNTGNNSNNHSNTGNSTNNHSGTGGNSNSNTDNSSGDKKPAPTPEKKKVWVEPVYEYIEHPAETVQDRYQDGIRCKCGDPFPDSGAWQAHRPVPCNGDHNYYEPIYKYETVVIKPAWTEKKEITPGHWKEI